MYRRSCVLCCCMLLFLVSASDLKKNFKNDDEQNIDLTAQYNLHTNSKKVQSDEDELIQYNSHENSTKNYDKVQREFRINSMKDNHDNDSMYYFRAHTIKNNEDIYHQTKLGSVKTLSSMKANDENSSASQPIYGNFTNTEGKNNYTVDNNNIFPNETCKNNTCIQLCCPHGDRLIQEKCMSGKGNYSFPDVHGYTSNNSLQSEDKSLDEVFQLIVRDPCQEIKRRFVVHPNEYMIFANGSLYLRSYDTFISSTLYCLAAVNRDIYDVSICKRSYPMIISVSVVISLPFLLATFVVYSILPELRNMHGYTLRAHVVSLFVSYAILAIFHQIAMLEMGYSVCILLGYLFSFSFLASMFWLNVICFDIWWTFREVRSLQRNVKQEERKKIMLYSLYAWGCALVLGIIQAIVEYVPIVGKYLIQPKYCKSNTLFSNPKARSLYFYLPIGITIISNICFFVMTTLKIVQYKRRTAKDLRNSESRRHDANKQRFTMYLKLFIVMGITWIMDIISWFHSKDVPNIIWYPTDMINSLQGVIIFVIFVCTKKIMRLLLKRLGWQDLLGKKSASNDCHSSTTTISSSINLQNVNPRAQAN